MINVDKCNVCYNDFVKGNANEGEQHKRKVYLNINACSFDSMIFYNEKKKYEKK